jgi:hypothetical protein
MSYAVYHTEKGSTSSGGIGKHIDREKGAEHTYKHSDPERRHLNQNIAVTPHCSKPLNMAISDRIKEGYSAKNKAGELKEIRKDAVKYNTHILTGSHEKMKEIENDPQKRNEWIQSNLNFIKSEFGEKNIVRFSVHRDEKTMHIHAVTVKITEDGRLSAKEIVGNKKVMQERQDRYADQMQKFGLERGIRNTGTKHENQQEFYARMEKALQDGNKNAPEDVKKAVFGIEVGIDKEKTIENLKTENKSQKTAISMQKNELFKLKEERKKDAEYKTKIIERTKDIDEKLKYAVLSDTARERLKQEKINEIGKRYGSEVKQKFHFISHSIQQKTDEEISNSVSSAVKKIGEEKKLSSVDTALLMRSREVKEITEHLKNERDRRNDIDKNQNRKRGI